MAVRVGSAVFDDWQTLEYPPAGWTDTFILRVRHDAGLPPGDYAEGLRKLFRPLTRLRHGASVWIQVDAPGMWYAREVRRALRGSGLPVAVTLAGVLQPKVESFSIPPADLRVPSGPPPRAEAWPTPLPEKALRCLQALARLQEAYPAEVAALGGMGVDTARRLLKQLEAAGMVRYIADRVTPGREKSHPFWQLTRRGTSAALRSWGLPAGYYFPERREHRTPLDGRHRRVARLWPAWVKKAWPLAEVWAGWSEVRLRGLHATPDALAWGRLDGGEVLFWLEVESGHASRELLCRKLSRRLARASIYAENLGVRLVFVLLGMPWVQAAARSALAGITGNVALVSGDWGEFGVMPGVEWGGVRLGIDGFR